MTRFLIRRIGQALIVLLGVILITFFLARLIPGGEARAVLGTKATAPGIARFNRINGLDLPIWDQFWQYLEGIFVHLNLGYSYKYNQGVRQVIGERLPKTLTLVGFSVLLALVIAIPLGILQVVRRNKPIDYAVTGTSFFFYAMPDFLIGTLLIIWFSFDLHWFPVSPPERRLGLGHRSPTRRAFVLPVITLAATTIASFSRYMRSSMMDATGRGLHPHGPGQRGIQPAGPLRSRPPQRPHPVPHAARALASGHRERRPDRRDGLQLPGDGPAHRAVGLQRRHPDGARHHPGHHRGHRDRLIAGRHPLRGGRPAHPIGGRLR